MSDVVATSSAPAPSAPASSGPASDSVSVGTRNHQPPQRSARSARETGEPAARRDPTAPPPKRKEAVKPPREKHEAAKTDEFKAKLAGEPASAEGEPVVEEALEEAVEAKADGEGEEPGEEAKAEPEYPPEVKAKLDEVEKFRSEVTAKAQEVLRENSALSRKLEWLQQAIDEAGLEIDPQALELFDLRTEKELGADFTKKAAEQAEAARKAEHEKAVQAEVQKVNAEITKAAKAAKVEEVALKARWAAMVKVWQHTGGQGDMPTLDDAVFELKAVSDAKQIKASSSAPALVKSKGAPSVAATPRHENTHDGWRRHLRSRGFAD